jgi:uncharacterized protein DUF5615
MALSFYMDVHVPAAITQGLRRRGIDVLTSQDDGTRQASDEQLMTRATELGRVLISQDEDLLVVTARWLAVRQMFSGLIFMPQQAGSIGRYIDDLELMGVCCTQAEMQSHVHYLPLR